MNFMEYQSAALRTAPEETQNEALNHAALGLFTEGGEFTSEVKRIVKYGKVMTPEMHSHMVEELGGVLWYVAVGCNALGVSMKKVAELNIVKLLARFPPDSTKAEIGTLAEARMDKSGVGHRES